MYYSLIGETTTTISQSLSDGFSLASAQLVVGFVLSQTATICEQITPFEGNFWQFFFEISFFESKYRCFRMNYARVLTL
jgi:hypothetical protein